MSANLDFPWAVMRNHLVGVDRVFEFTGIAGNSEQSQRNGYDVIGKGGHRSQIFELKLPGLPEARIQKPDGQLRQLVELDAVAFIEADIAEARKFAHEAVH